MLLWVVGLSMFTSLDTTYKFQQMKTYLQKGKRFKLSKLQTGMHFLATTPGQFTTINFKNILILFFLSQIVPLSTEVPRLRPLVRQSRRDPKPIRGVTGYAFTAAAAAAGSTGIYHTTNPWFRSKALVQGFFRLNICKIYPECAFNRRTSACRQSDFLHYH